MTDPSTLSSSWSAPLHKCNDADSEARIVTDMTELLGARCSRATAGHGCGATPMEPRAPCVAPRSRLLGKIRPYHVDTNCRSHPRRLHRNHRCRAELLGVAANYFPSAILDRPAASARRALGRRVDTSSLPVVWSDPTGRSARPRARVPPERAATAVQHNVQTRVCWAGRTGPPVRSRASGSFRQPTHPTL